MAMMMRTLTTLYLMFGIVAAAAAGCGVHAAGGACAAHVNCNSYSPDYPQYWNSYCTVDGECAEMRLCPRNNDAIDCVCPLAPAQKGVHGGCLVVGGSRFHWPNEIDLELVCVIGEAHSDPDFSSICTPAPHTRSPSPCLKKNGGYGTCAYNCTSHANCSAALGGNAYLEYSSTQLPVAYCGNQGTCNLGILDCYELGDGISANDCACPPLRASAGDLGYLTPPQRPCTPDYPDNGNWSGAQYSFAGCTNSVLTGLRKCSKVRSTEGSATCDPVHLGTCEYLPPIQQPLWYSQLYGILAAMITTGILVYADELAKCMNNAGISCWQKCQPEANRIVILPLYKRVYIAGIFFYLLSITIVVITAGTDSFRANIRTHLDANGFVAHACLFMMGMPTLSRKDMFKSIKIIGCSFAAQFIFIALLGGVWLLADVNVFLLLGYSNVNNMLQAVKTAGQGAFDHVVFWPVFFAYRRFYARSKFRESCKPLLYTCAVLDAFKMGSQLVLLYIVLALVDATEDEAAGTKLASDVLTGMTLATVLISGITLWVLQGAFMLSMKRDTDYWRGMSFMDRRLPNKYRDLYAKVYEDEKERPLLAADKNAASVLQVVMSENTVIDFSHLTLGKLLGQGAFAEVYKGTYKGGEVAVKVLQNEHLGEAEITAFAQEMAVSASMTHPNVLKTFGVCVCPPDVSLVYEYCSRGSLLGLLPLLQTWDWPRKISLMLQIARGVTYLHVRGTIHRDLKPDNVLITEDWTAKVADFGLTRIINGDRATDSGLWYDVSGWCCAGTLGELESKIPMFNSAEESEFSRDSGKGESKASSIDVALVAGPYSKASRTSTPTSSSSSSSGFLTTNVGTPGYTAPEVIAGDDDYDLSVDVFALAVLMWQCATSEEDPWPECRSSWDVSDAITDGRRPKITHVAFQGCDPALPQLISAMWSQDPLSRPTVQDVVKRLEEMSGRDK